MPSRPSLVKRGEHDRQGDPRGQGERPDRHPRSARPGPAGAGTTCRETMSLYSASFTFCRRSANVFRSSESSTWSPSSNKPRRAASARTAAGGPPCRVGQPAQVPVGLAEHPGLGHLLDHQVLADGEVDDRGAHVERVGLLVDQRPHLSWPQVLRRRELDDVDVLSRAAAPAASRVGPSAHHLIDLRALEANVPAAPPHQEPERSATTRTSSPIPRPR